MPFTFLLKDAYIGGLEDQKLINTKTNEEFSVQKQCKYQYRFSQAFDGLKIKRGARKNAD